jgi:hypothetical protein
MSFALLLPRIVMRAVRTALVARFGRFRSWPSEALLLDEPLALAEARTSRLRRIYANAQRDAWDGPALFRDAMARHGGIQLSEEKRRALAHPISMLMWGELAAWIVSAELAERLEDPDARMAASSQVFDEARHFYVLRDYLAALHVPVPPLDRFFAIAARALLTSRDLDLKLFAMQILAEGTAQAIFQFLAGARIEPVLSEILPYVERDEARHVGLGILHLPERLAKRSARDRRRLSERVNAIGDLFGATQIRFIGHYRTLGIDPRDLFRRADRMLHELSRKLGSVPGTGEPYFRTANPSDPQYERNLDYVLPRDGVAPPPGARAFRHVLDVGVRLLPV